MTSSLSEYERILRMMGGSKGKGKEPERLEDVLAVDTAKIDETIRPTKETEVLPIPSMDMTLGELSELMQKYKLVIEHGGYLALFTNLKATPVSSTDPEVEGRQMMGVEEEKLYDWFKSYGRLDEFDWDVCRMKGETPAGKQARFNQELLALRIMYKSDKLDAENLYWLRHERGTHFKVVLAFTKIIRAANNINQGITKGSGYDYKEYQTTNKLIATSGAIVNNFMEDVHKLLKPIEEGKGLIMARRYEMAKKCGISMERMGDAVRDAKELGRSLPGKVTAPFEKPRAVKRLRDNVDTIANLRKLEITKRVRLEDFPKVGDLRVSGAPNADDYDMHVKDYEPTDPDRPDVFGGMPFSDVTTVSQVLKAINEDVFDDKMAHSLSTLAVTGPDIDKVKTARIRVNTRGDKTMSVPRGLSQGGTTLVALINRRLRLHPDEEGEIAKRAKDGTIAGWMMSNGGFVTLADAHVTGGGGGTTAMQV
jgi:hypothetical protein